MFTLVLPGTPRQCRCISWSVSALAKFLRASSLSHGWLSNLLPSIVFLFSSAFAGNRQHDVENGCVGMCLLTVVLHKLPNHYELADQMKLQFTLDAIRDGKCRSRWKQVPDTVLRCIEWERNRTSTQITREREHVLSNLEREADRLWYHSF
jgi:hypothetical protein